MNANKSSTTQFRLDAANPPSLTAEQAKRLDTVPIDYADIPELAASFWATAEHVGTANKSQVTLRLDADVLTFFRGSGRKYQTRINAVLRAYVEAQKKAHG
ncbi:BrnA antitoxin family protein [Vogesella indigofera]|uniref:BrnA antitoxin family protein n=1 Tax=Vogesella indigofera TaxID=45465 RepID=UPI00234C2424|nr:BrnA antitoxin family protein [Vogesella indigofera]MDC7705931.1 BrnA antitoxin family protein [Vogesella indigofera]